MSLRSTLKRLGKFSAQWRLRRLDGQKAVQDNWGFSRHCGLDGLTELTMASSDTARVCGYAVKQACTGRCTQNRAR